MVLNDKCMAHDSNNEHQLNMDLVMKGINASALCLIASLGTSVQAADNTEIKIKMTQLTGKHCSNELKSNNIVVAGDCITYRIEVENIGERTARYVEVSALIPEHTELHTTFRKLSDHQNLGSLIEKNSDGQRMIKTTLETLPAHNTNRVVLEYSVKVI